MVPLKDAKNNRIIKNGKELQSRELQYNIGNKKVIVQDHSAGHNFGGVGNQPSHFNVRPITNTKTGKVKGTQEHYYFKKKR